MRRLGFAGAALIALLAAGCGGHAPVTFIGEGQPARLDDWHVLRIDDGRLVLNEGVVPYDLNTPLFSDYAHKLRTIWMPKGTSAQYRADTAFEFPVGTNMQEAMLKVNTKLAQVPDYPEDAKEPVINTSNAAPAVSADATTGTGVPA